MNPLDQKLIDVATIIQGRGTWSPELDRVFSQASTMLERSPQERSAWLLDSFLTHLSDPEKISPAWVYSINSLIPLINPVQDAISKIGTSLITILKLHTNPLRDGPPSNGENDINIRLGIIAF